MSFFDMVFKANPAGTLMLATLNLSPHDVGRYRTTWIEKSPEGNIRVAVYSRNGGGNRECIGGHGDDEPCYGCIQTKVLPHHPLYLFDKDDDFDSTYCTTYFKVPDDLKELLDITDPGWIDDVQPTVNMSEEWHKAIDAMKQQM